MFAKCECVVERLLYKNYKCCKITPTYVRALTTDARLQCAHVSTKLCLFPPPLSILFSLALLNKNEARTPWRKIIIKCVIDDRRCEEFPVLVFRSGSCDDHRHRKKKIKYSINSIMRMDDLFSVVHTQRSGDNKRQQQKSKKKLNKKIQPNKTAQLKQEKCVFVFQAIG